MELRGTARERHCRKTEGWKARVRDLPAIMLPQTACAAGDRPALMNKVTNLSLIWHYQRWGEKD